MHMIKTGGFGEGSLSTGEDSGEVSREKGARAAQHERTKVIFDMVLDCLRSPYGKNTLGVKENDVVAIAEKVVDEVKFHTRPGGVTLTKEVVDYAAASVVHAMNQAPRRDKSAA